MPAPTKAKESQAFQALSLDGMFLLTPDQHRTVAKDLRRQVNDPKAQELATATKSWRWRYRSTSTNKCRRLRRNRGCMLRGAAGGKPMSIDAEEAAIRTVIVGALMGHSEAG